MFYKIYCDGAASNNGYENAIGGWAFVVLDKDENVVLERAEMVKGATNNRMELYAAYMGLSSLLEEKQDVEEVEVYTDSAYVLNAFEQDWITNWQLKGWRTASKKEVLNKDLWLELLEMLEKHKVNFIKVKGHSDNYNNNRCDEIARNEILKLS